MLYFGATIGTGRCYPIEECIDHKEQFMFRSCLLAVLAFAVAGPANATDPVAAGIVSRLSYRNGYVMFRLETGTGNARPLSGRSSGSGYW